MVYEHLRKIKLQRASLYEPSKLRKLAANAASSFAANCTCSLKIATYNLTSCRSHLQQYKPLAAMPLATKSITCSNINQNSYSHFLTDGSCWICLNWPEHSQLCHWESKIWNITVFRLFNIFIRRLGLGPRLIIN